MDAWGVALPGEEFGAVEAEGVDAEEDLGWGGVGHGAGFKDEGGRAAWGVEDCCFHCFW